MTFEYSITHTNESQSEVLSDCMLSIIWCCVFFSLPVPIIPSYLYSMDEATTTATPLAKNNTPSPQYSSGSFQNIVSLYDNSVRVTSGDTTPSSMDQKGPPTVATPVTLAPPNNSDCPKSDGKLLKENVKVGLLFASKATVQLITNPFIGPLTNRWVTGSVVMGVGVLFVLVYRSGLTVVMQHET